MDSSKAKAINQEIHETIKKESIDNKENIIFISISEYMDILKVSSETRNKVNQLVEYAKKAISGLEKQKYTDLLDEWYLEEYKYLKQVNKYLGIGWDNLGIYYNRPYPI